MQKSILHPFEPIIFDDSEILILGTFPSIKSFENNFYYSHPKNQFWHILSRVYNQKLPVSIDEKKEFLKRNKIALWDVICECRRKENNSRDDNLDVINVCKIDELVKKYNIKKIALTSRKAEMIFKKNFKYPYIYLPSPSPLNAKMNLDEKVKEWQSLLLM
jgi:hypoxanthine-DNA glycosylase